MTSDSPVKKTAALAWCRGKFIYEMAALEPVSGCLLGWPCLRALSIANGSHPGIDVHAKKKYAHVVFFGPIKLMHAQFKKGFDQPVISEKFWS